MHTICINKLMCQVFNKRTHCLVCNFQTFVSFNKLLILFLKICVTLLKNCIFSLGLSCLKFPLRDRILRNNMISSRLRNCRGGARARPWRQGVIPFTLCYICIMNNYIFGLPFRGNPVYHMIKTCITVSTLPSFRLLESQFFGSPFLKQHSVEAQLIGKLSCRGVR